MRHARSHHRHPVWRGVGLTVSAALTLAFSAVATYAYLQEANLTRSTAMDLVAQPGGPDEAETTRDLTILLLGSDSRDGENEQIGGASSGRRSDTTIVMHVSAARDRVELISIPRDSVVDIPACLMADGTTTSPQPGAQINAAFSIGWNHGGTTDTERQDSAIACAVATVQASTGLTIDHFVVVDFVGFQNMVTALGGVDICIEEDLKDSRFTGLDLSAGPHHLDGAEALQLARARHVEHSDGMDPSRISRQQQLLSAMATEALSNDTAADAPRLAVFVNQVTSALTVDERLDPVGLAWALRGIQGDDIVLETIPWQLYPQNPSWVVWTPEAEAVWAAMAADTPVAAALHPADPTGPAPGPSAPSDLAPDLPGETDSTVDQPAPVCPSQA